MEIGDSKSVGSLNAWPGALVTALGVATAGVQTWRDDNVSVSAIGAAYFAANIASILAAQKDNHTVVLVNLGVNDFSSATHSQWVADVSSVVDAIVTRWPGTRVYLMRPWKRGYNAVADTFAGWIGEVIAAHSFVHAGPDERVWLKGSDDGGANTTDGIHYSAAGQAAAVTAWRSVLGY